MENENRILKNEIEELKKDLQEKDVIQLLKTDIGKIKYQIENMDTREEFISVELDVIDVQQYTRNNIEISGLPGKILRKKKIYAWLSLRCEWQWVSSNDANQAWRFFHSNTSDAVVRIVPTRYKDDIYQLHKNLSVLLGLIMYEWSWLWWDWKIDFGNQFMHWL